MQASAATVHRALSLDDKQPSASRAYIGLRSNGSTYNPKPLGSASAGARIDVRSVCLQGCSYRCLCYVVAALVVQAAYGARSQPRDDTVHGFRVHKKNGREWSSMKVRYIHSARDPVPPRNVLFPHLLLRNTPLKTSARRHAWFLSACTSYHGAGQHARAQPNMGTACPYMSTDRL
jgi:hypothetical protein